MNTATSIGVFLIPMLYVTFQAVRERSKVVFARRKKREHATTPGE